MDALAAFTPATRSWFERAFAAPTPAQEAAWPVIATGAHVLVQAPTGSGKTLAAFLTGIDRLNASPGEGLRLLYVSPAEGAQLRRRAQPARPARRARLEAHGRRPHGRHRPARAPPDAAHAAGHPDHDAGVALPPPHLAGPGDAARRRDGDRRRGARRRGTKRGAHLALSLERLERVAEQPFQRIGLSATQRPLEEIGRFVSGGRPIELVDAGTRKELDLEVVVALEDMREPGSDPSLSQPVLPDDVVMDVRLRGDRAVDLALDLPGAARPRAAAPLDDRVRQQPPARGAAGAAAERARGRDDRPCPPRLARARAARRDRGAAEGGADPVPRRDVVARARHRHGRRRPRDPGREPEVGRARPAAGRPRRARPRRRLEGAHLPEVPRRPARVGRRREGDARGRDRGDADPPQPARRARAADRRDLRRRRDRGRRPLRPRPRRLPVRRSRAHRSSRTCSTCSPGRYPSDEFAELRPRIVWDRTGRRRQGAPGRAAARGHERGHDPRPRPLRRLPGRRRRQGRRARRGDGLRGAPGPDVHARRLDVADRGDHARPGARLARARASRVRCRSGRARASAGPFELGEKIGRASREIVALSGREGARAPARRLPPRPARGEEPPHVPARPGGGERRRRPLRPHDRRRALPRRDRRLAPLHPDAVRRAGACAVGDGARRAAARRARARGAVDLVGRRHRAPPAGGRRAAAGRRPAPHAGGDRGARRAGGRADGALRRRASARTRPARS